MSTGQRPHSKAGANIFGDDDDVDDDEFIDNINCFTGIFPAAQTSPGRGRQLGKHQKSNEIFLKMNYYYYYYYYYYDYYYYYYYYYCWYYC